MAPPSATRRRHLSACVCRLWQHVTRAINNKDQTEATNEKFILEESQRKSARERKAKCEEWVPALFEQDPVGGEWHYRYAE